MTSHADPAHAPALGASATEGHERSATVLVYASHDPTRARVISAIGRRPFPGLVIEYVEASAGEQVVHRCDAGGIDLAILDSEASPTGGMGLARQLKDELDAPPPVLLLVARRDDAWLATWSRAEAVVPLPIDAVQIGRVVAGLLAPAAAQPAH
jgi:DNA-binding NarL/FixJ family response regulator